MTTPSRVLLTAAFLMTTPLTPLAMASIALTPAETERIARAVWKNECAGTVEGLVSWNRGEGFPSLGIGHFIWYPANARGPFDESFPRLAALLAERGLPVPSWARGPAPWKNRAEMVADKSRVEALRKLLSSPAALRVQAEFLRQRLESALPKLLKAAPGAREQALIRERFQRLSASAAGTFALIDYVNFKGEGVLPTERYNGEGWGLLQVLLGMKGEGEPVADFARSAAQTLSRRVHNAPPARNEGKWLSGWHNRVKRYPSF